MAQFIRLSSKIVAMPVNDIDTDQIIPARFLKVTDKNSLAGNLFADWRYNADGSPKPEFVLNQPFAAGRQILLAGENFGCGSSREHAPWALTGYGFRAVISTSFADIFKNNALKNGLLPVVVDDATHKKLFALAESHPESELTIDLETQSVLLPDGSAFSFPVDPFSKTCLLKGVDELGYLLGFASQVSAFEANLESK